MAEASERLYRVEYAKSGRASCKKCSESIPKDSLRMAIMVQSPMFDGKVPHWYHFSCFWKVGHSIRQPDVEVDGFSELRWDDQQKVKKIREICKFIFDSAVVNCSKGFLTNRQGSNLIIFFAVWA
ncbi:poly [ADP-ribose] polymerase 1-like [Chionomys nivalis]|uniref:poly [ADP-ribose] polymerase 1-like n=1 Tax=Chionomys nivalis TaxID=269649 RepID=UPI002593E905|nr:poly [ADP-ribose] polymerase 1-like [Chionomys nivalis]